MFEKALKEKMLAIFGIPRVSYDEPAVDPSDTKQQECVFLKIDTVTSKIKEGKATCMAVGSMAVYVNSEKMPFSFFHKKIAASPEEAKDLFFYKFDQNTKYFGNLVERKCNFVYFYDSQYDPEHGQLTSFTLEEVV